MLTTSVTNYTHIPETPHSGQSSIFFHIFSSYSLRDGVAPDDQTSGRSRLAAHRPKLVMTVTPGDRNWSISTSVSIESASVIRR